ncbi:MAG: di-trans,poly-cis-decaprenylcistransferase [Spirochaetales bacterium]|nr:di-trans,poly-cis-decaprenylcistransferase [Spirochaetales bacterium]MBQ2295054.1 di-trans,poly-cis-decaprenylcistransferase [Spirochaetales bacterium]
MSSKEKKLEHISFIMDGNGRWAKKRLLPRTFGHKEGVKKAKEVILHAKSHGIPFVSLYTFSKENWKRPADEVSFLMKLIIDHFKNDFQFYIDNQIRIVHIGDKEGIPTEVRKAIEEIENDSKDFNSVTVLLVFNYSGQYDIMQAVNRMLTDKVACTDENEIRKYLLTANYPDPDLIVRTSGEFRISNYFLYQAAYSEFYVTNTLWPDMSMDEINKAIESFYQRERRFGGV